MIGQTRSDLQSNLCRATLLCGNTVASCRSAAETCWGHFKLFKQTIIDLWSNFAPGQCSWNWQRSLLTDFKIILHTLSNAITKHILQVLWCLEKLSLIHSLCVMPHHCITCVTPPSGGMKISGYISGTCVAITCKICEDWFIGQYFKTQRDINKLLITFDQLGLVMIHRKSCSLRGAVKNVFFKKLTIAGNQVRRNLTVLEAFL